MMRCEIWAIILTSVLVYNSLLNRGMGALIERQEEGGNLLIVMFDP